MKKEILFLLPYSLGRAPSQRFRVEAYFSLLDEHHITYSTHEFLNDGAWEILYKKGSVLKKIIAVCRGFIGRAKVVFLDARKYSYVFIHREASPLGPPIFEWFLARVLKKKIVYDFDDAIWIPNKSAENRLINWVKAFWKVQYICRWAYKIAGGNSYLCDYAYQFNDKVVLLPTSVDTNKRYNQLKDQCSAEIIIGWTGSHSTMKYLNPIVPILSQLSKESDITTIIISNKKPEFEFPRLKFLPWKEATEIEDLLKLNIGIMPLEDDAWSEGKCGFKLIQYLALGIPAVASPVGVNKNIVENGVNGFLCATKEQWTIALQTLINNQQLRKEMGEKGREKIKNQFSVQVNAPIFLGLFN